MTRDEAALVDLDKRSDDSLKKSIRTHDILYWVYGVTAIEDTTFDKLVNEYKRRHGQDGFMERLGMYPPGEDVSISTRVHEWANARRTK